MQAVVAFKRGTGKGIKNEWLINKIMVSLCLEVEHVLVGLQAKASPMVSSLATKFASMGSLIYHLLFL